MGDQCSTGTDCRGIGCCGATGGSPMRVVLSGAGQCGPVGCSPTDKNCVSECCGKMMGGSCCKVVMGRMQDCTPGKGSCQTIERRCIEITSEE
jgi:hypothetical protein